MELNREQIVKALECCSDGGRCKDCPYDSDCFIPQWVIVKDALALIRELTEERDRLELTLAGIMHFVDKWLDREELKQEDEVARAITMREKTLHIVEKLTEEVVKAKADTVRKMRKKLKLKGQNMIHPKYHIDCLVVSFEDIDQTAEELLEETK